MCTPLPTQESDGVRGGPNTGRPRRRDAMPLPPDPVGALTPEEKSTWDAAVTYYDRNVASRDLLFDDDLTHVKLALADADDALGSVRIDEALRSTLLEAAPIYRKYWWTDHDAANHSW